MNDMIPPIKSQGIKTKLVPQINHLINRAELSANSRWLEPFFGTGVVGFNSPLQGISIVGDTNPHIINFYKAIQDGVVTAETMRRHLANEGALLRVAANDGAEHYKLVRNRFNAEHDPHDFIFLSRAGFNGMMRFNRSGGWNIPFCKKPNRFAPSYVTKICNQVQAASDIIQAREWHFNVCPFEDIILQATEDDIIYCDPPYLGRYVDYYNGWTMEDEAYLFELLSNTKAKFILSTWHHNQYRKNEMIDKFWGKFNLRTSEHFYHVGGKIENRNAMVEALFFNFDVDE